MKKAQLGNRLYSVISMEEYTNNPEIYNPRYTAIEKPYAVLPLASRSIDSGPGIYYQQGAMVAMVQKPTNPDEYSTSQIINYNDAKSIGDIIKNNQLIRDIQNDIITTSDNIFFLKIGDDDTPEMRALKQAINSKQVDKKQYEDLFEQYQNDMRLLKGSSITLGKLVSICTAFDIGVDLTLRDKEDCPNPMNTEIVVDLTEGRK